jgi:DNA-binding response OmpR family regulator
MPAIRVLMVDDSVVVRRLLTDVRALLEFLLRNLGRTVSPTEIIQEVWHAHNGSITNVVDVYINYLRRKIDSGSERPLIRTIRGIGYQIGRNNQLG